MQVEKGVVYPFGAVLVKGGVNFSVYVKDAEVVKVCLYHEKDPGKAYEKIEMQRSGDVWHVFVKDVGEGVVYGYEVARKGETRVLLDPYAKGVFSEGKWHAESRKEMEYRPLGKVVGGGGGGGGGGEFDWERDKALNIPKKDMVIYEMHVRGFTCDVSSGVKEPGTFKGIIEKIGYLKDLGVNVLELMPIQEFCEEDVIQVNPETKKKLHNYFGYSTINFFSLMNRYASESEGDKARVEFKTLVKELHKNGIEVILDVVFNHTLEGNEKGQVLSFKGLDNNAYYMMNGENQYLNYSGCGNTFNCNQPVTMELIIAALRYWVIEYHVDGFRFDLAAVFNRGTDGAPIEKAPLMEFISADPVLSNVKLIGEPWDAGGLYQVGKFAAYGDRWADWNGNYQKTIRNFIKGSPKMKGNFAAALCGYKELYPRGPYGSVNYITAHDGFCLRDLVSYNEKHNLANGDNNKDGNSDNNSWNCGFEGETTNKKVLNLRRKQMRNFHLALMLSQGIPMVLMGDEYGHTRMGNNNPWCQDNQMNWFLWNKIEENRGFYNYYRFLIHFRKTHPLLHFENHLTEKEIKWHGINPDQPGWEEDNRVIAFTLHFPDGKPGLYAAFNTSQNYHNLTIPSPGEGKGWQWVVNTQNNPPDDFYDETRQAKLEGNMIRIAPYSSLLLKTF